MRPVLKATLAVLTLVVTFAVAIYLHELQTTSAIFHTSGPPGTIGHLLVAEHQHPAWATPAAFGLVLAGMVVAARIFVRLR